ncbi:hypothetical protein AB0D90_23465 [Streptomyces althioticus]|uniref:hypothetical protein n=1 Tax=Streptomyces althioticus TaxID=83380 RepID=UPI0033C72AC1
MNIDTTTWGPISAYFLLTVTAIGVILNYRTHAANRRDKIREQAAKVTVFAEEDIGRVTNDSDLPIFRMALLVKRGPEKNPDYVQHLWKTTVTHNWVQCPVRRLAAEEEITLGLPDKLPKDSEIVGLRFDDASGRTWTRGIDGRLRQSPGRLRHRFRVGPTPHAVEAPVFLPSAVEPGVQLPSNAIPAPRTSEEADRGHLLARQRMSLDQWDEAQQLAGRPGFVMEREAGSGGYVLRRDEAGRRCQARSDEPHRHTRQGDDA